VLPGTTPGVSGRKEQNVITATQPEISVIDRKQSLEVRWILPGAPAAAVADWFARFETAVESREDAYLPGPRWPGVSVKLRSGRALEVKVYRGSPGILEVTGCARGRLESWDKWSFPDDPPGRSGAAAVGWRPVRKLIRRFTLAPPGGTRRPGPAEVVGCDVELTEIYVRGQAWWTLGFEATGATGLLRGELETAAALVFAQALPEGVELGTGNSQSYAQWLTDGRVVSGR
jgi:hypothetical protein